MIIRILIIAMLSFFMGSRLTVTTIVEYILKERNSSKEIYRKTIDTSYTAGFSDSPDAARCMIMAIEGSARNNIHEFLQALNELKTE